MATNLYLVDDQSFVTPTAGTKATNLPKATNRVAAGSEVEGNLSTFWGGTGNIVNRTTTNTPSTNQSYYFGRFSSKLLAAQTIPAQTWNWRVIVGEGSTQANSFMWPVMYVWRPSNNTVVGYIFDASAAFGSEIAATPGTTTRNFAGASVTTQEGDILVVEAWTSGTPGSGTYTQTWRMTDNTSYIASPYTILFKPDTILYFQETLPAVVPTAGSKAVGLPKATHTNSNKGTLEGLLSTTLIQNPLGAEAYPVAQTGEQSTYWGRFSTPPLAAQTIPAQEWGWEISSGTQKADAVYYNHPVLYGWRPSTNSVVGYIFDGSVAKGVPWRTNIDPLLSQKMSGAALTLQAGDILVAEIWAVGTQGTAVTSQHMVWTTAVNASLVSPYVILPQGALAPILADLTVTEGADTVSATATVADPPRTATLTRTEAQDTLSATVTVAPFPVINATLSVTEATDSLDANGSSVSTPLLSTFQEDFEATLNPAKWSTDLNNGTVVFANGVGEFTHGTPANGVHASLVSVENFDFRNSSAYYKLVQPPRWAGDPAGVEFAFTVESAGDNRIDWTLYSNGELALIKFTNGAWGHLTTVTSNYYAEQNTYRWLRHREQAGTIYFESAPDTASNPPLEGEWVVRYSAAAAVLPILLSSTQVIYRLWVSSATVGLPTQTAKIDGLNTAAGAASPATATLARTEASDTLAATAKATAGATLTRTEAQDTIAATASSGIVANLAKTEAPDTLTAAASSPATGTLTRTEAPDTLAAAASSPVTATLARTEAADTLSATASVIPFPTINASLAVTEANDTVVSTSGFQGSVADLSKTEAPDTISASASSPVRGNLTRTEANDTIVASASSPATGNLSRTEAPDTISAAAKVGVVVTLAVTEAADTLSSDATVVTERAATLDVTESPDTLVATATVTLPPRTANLSVTEAPDSSLAYAHHAKKRVILIT